MDNPGKDERLHKKQQPVFFTDCCFYFQLCAYRLDSANREIVVCRVPTVGAWCAAQRIKITMIAGGNDTIISYQPPAAFRFKSTAF